MTNSLLFASLFLFLNFWASYLYSEEMIQPRRLVDAPTAGVLARGNFDFECRVYPGGDQTKGAGVNLGINVGVTNRLMIGLSYGGEGIVGRGKDAHFDKVPGFLVKYRIFEEGLHFPGVSLGYDHQGHGGSADTSEFDYKGYVYKSPGFFLALSKNYLLFSKIQLGIHGALTYSMEDFKEVSWPNFLTGIDLGVNEELALVVEYDFGFNIKDKRSSGHPIYASPSEGYLNLGLRWAFSENFYIEFDARDVLENRKRKDGSTVSWGRELKLVYVSHF